MGSYLTSTREIQANNLGPRHPVVADPHITLNGYVTNRQKASWNWTPSLSVGTSNLQALDWTPWGTNLSNAQRTVNWTRWRKKKKKNCTSCKSRTFIKNIAVTMSQNATTAPEHYSAICAFITAHGSHQAYKIKSVQNETHHAWFIVRSVNTTRRVYYSK